ncbi:hypothetical protein Q1695_012721 [Nippostrongylus brasiliensis]|nr:hypothetical protein Q1695_012721 [Nippostrongylus brasiliensis]
MYHDYYDMESPSSPDLSLHGGPDDYEDEMRQGREALIKLNKVKEVLQPILPHRADSCTVIERRTTASGTTEPRTLPRTVE